MSTSAAVYRTDAEATHADHQDLPAATPLSLEPLGRHTSVAETLAALTANPLPSSKPMRLADADALALERHINELARAANPLPRAADDDFPVQSAGSTVSDAQMTTPQDDRPDLQDYAAIAAALDNQAMPIPSIWRESAAPANPRKRLGVEMTAALLGFAGGLVIVVPAAIWLSSNPAPTVRDVSREPAAASAAASRPSAPLQKAALAASAPRESGSTALAAASVGHVAGRDSNTAEPAPAMTTARVSAEAITPRIVTSKPIVVARAEISREQPRVTDDRSPAPPTATISPEASIDMHLGIAKRLISSSDIARAREVLSDERFSNHPRIVFALAETYDPNILAAWGVRGIAAEPRRARALYLEALGGGISDAARRLDALK